jgi:hypothetical protein
MFMKYNKIFFTFHLCLLLPTDSRSVIIGPGISPAANVSNLSEIPCMFWNLKYRSWVQNVLVYYYYYYY